MTNPTAVLGWDIGGVNTKVTRLQPALEKPACRSVSLPYEVQREPGALGQVLAAAAREVRAEATDWHAVTMTAELSQAFRTKREGVGFVLDALEAEFPGAVIQVYTVDEQFVTAAEARARPLMVAASNWAATAAWIARMVPSCILIDIGTTSTDLIPIVSGRVEAQGHTDPERLLSGELVYSGVLRTPAEAVTPQVPLWGGQAGVSADGFALIGDAHLWRGHLSPEDYTCRAPDGRPATRSFAGERLARIVCADREMLDDSDIDSIAGALAHAQLDVIAHALTRLRHRWPEIDTAVVAGLGDFVAANAARAAGLKVLPLAELLGPSARTAPAATVAWLLWQRRKATA